MNPLIRIADADDVPQIEVIIHEAYKGYVERLGRKPAPMEADYRRLVEDRCVWVMTLADSIVGVMVLRPKPEHLQVSNVAVSPQFQGQRLGSQLLSHAEEQARERGLSELRLFTNELMHENIAIYQRLGWSEYDRGEQDGYRRVFMAKTLD